MADEHRPRPATPDDAELIAQLLEDFNTEFDTPSPGVHVLAPRLRTLLGDDRTFAILAGDPPVGVALVTLRPNVWYAGQVALLDELYVVPHLRDQGIGSAVINLLVSIALGRGVERIEINVDEFDIDTQRFYEHHSFSGTDETTGERAFYYSRDLTPNP